VLIIVMLINMYDGDHGPKVQPRSAHVGLGFFGSRRLVAARSHAMVSESTSEQIS
jgi:hypothetical protein